MTVIDHLKEPVLVPQSAFGQTSKIIMYLYADAITKCDCGNDLVLTQHSYGNPLYKGSCTCGLKWELLEGKIRTINTPTPCTPSN